MGKVLSTKYALGVKNKSTNYAEQHSFFQDVLLLYMLYYWDVIIDALTYKRI